MPPLIDCYVLVPTRSAATARAFLDHFLPRRRALADEYELPQFAEAPEQVFDTAEALLEALEARPGEPHALYWKNGEAGDARFAMIFPTRDGQTVFGISVEAGEDERVSGMLERLRAYFGAGCPAYAAFEEPPSSDAAGFRERAARRSTTGV